MKLPQQIFVVREGARGEEYLVAHEDLTAIEDATVVGIYVLKEQRKLLVTRQLQWESGVPPRTPKKR